MTEPRWWAKGLLFENCSCQLVCPGHISFKQLCTHERCRGHWAMRFDDGRFDGVALGGFNVVILFDSPQQMFAGEWTTAMYIDARANAQQRSKIEQILSGAVGGPWSVLARFVAQRLETQFVPIYFEDTGRHKRMWIADVFDTSIEAIRGKDKSGEVLLSNIFNQIHAPLQVLALGKTRATNRMLPVETENTHALYSQFSWQVE